MVEGRAGDGRPPPPPLSPPQSPAEKLPHLRALLASNNRVTAWAEVERLGGLTGLTELMLAGNPLATEYRDRGDAAAFRVDVLRRLPRLVKLDGLSVEAAERAAAAAAGPAAGGGLAKAPSAAAAALAGAPSTAAKAPSAAGSVRAAGA